MITPQEIRNATFESNFRGYKPEDVDKFLEKIAQEVEALQAEQSTYNQKLKILAGKIEEYRDQEETLKLALINAQRMGESIIKEAKQKAETIIREANIRSEDRERAADEEVTRSKSELKQMRQEIGHFKANVLNLYKQHIESLSLLAAFEEPVDRSAQPVPVQTYQAPVEEAPAEPEQPKEVVPEVKEAPKEVELEEVAPLLVDSPEVEIEMPAASEKEPRRFNLGPLVGEEMDTAEFDFSVENTETQAGDELPSVFDGFKGISFDD